MRSMNEPTTLDIVRNIENGNRAQAAEQITTHPEPARMAVAVLATLANDQGDAEAWRNAATAVVRTLNAGEPTPSDPEPRRLRGEELDRLNAERNAEAIKRANTTKAPATTTVWRTVRHQTTRHRRNVDSAVTLCGIGTEHTRNYSSMDWRDDSNACTPCIEAERRQIERAAQ